MNWFVFSFRPFSCVPLRPVACQTVFFSHLSLRKRNKNRNFFPCPMLQRVIVYYDSESSLISLHMVKGVLFCDLIIALQCVGLCVLTLGLFIMLTVAKVFDTWSRFMNISMQIDGQRLLVFNTLDCFPPSA